ncbi:hypothetical protein CKAH01_07832 [Colletotrichum kahawae]|uniref:DUF6590 domain-containing protein n=1 Tax=Colletotrichum kahawae TaxID=34407 RepID=A0AAD9Y5E2_COLKA|nr:hypothetical protein CKAH01_07832 [Colletotrichum kahawae]
MPKHSSSSKHKSKHDGGGGSPWSDWVWSAEYSKYYCYRMKRNGETEYKWDEGASSAQPQDEAAPRQQAEIDIQHGLDDLSLSDTPDSGYGYAYGSQAGSSHDTTKRSKRSKEQPTEYAEADEPDTSGDPDPTPDEVPPLDPFFGAQQETAQPAYEAESEPLPADTNTAYSTEYAQADAYQGDPQQDFAPEEIEAMQASDSHNFGYANEGESSTDSGYGAYSPEEDDDGTVTPKALGGPVGAQELAAYGERLDPRYRVEPSSKFKPGAIFKIVWSEPRGSTAQAAPTMSDKQSMKDPWGGHFHVGPRRFIVVATDEGHSTCVPILTYGGRGCRKSGVKPLKHGVIHERNRSAYKLPREPELGFPPVKARLNIEGERLSKESRVNYAKLTTIEHNIKVFFIGSIVKDEIPTIRANVDYCWEQKL